MAGEDNREGQRRQETVEREGGRGSLDEQKER